MDIETFQALYCSRTEQDSEGETQYGHLNFDGQRPSAPSRVDIRSLIPTGFQGHEGTFDLSGLEPEELEEQALDRAFWRNDQTLQIILVEGGDFIDDDDWPLVVVTFKDKVRYLVEVFAIASAYGHNPPEMPPDLFSEADRLAAASHRASV